MDQLQYVHSYMLKTGKVEKMPVYLYNYLLSYWIGNQFVQIMDTSLGRMMLINSIVQSAEGDRGIYESCMTSPLRSSDKEILIIGGGDGKLAAKILSLDSLVSITIVDIEKGIVELCRQYFRQTVFESKRVNLVIKDGSSFLEENLSRGKKFDFVLVDLTDEPVMDEGLEFRTFYNKLIGLIRQNLSADGHVCIQAGAAEFCDGLLNMIDALREISSGYFLESKLLITDVPSFGLDKAAFLHVSKPKQAM